MSALPVLAQRYLQRLEVPEQRAAVISFSEHWLVLGRFGELARIGLESLDDAALVDLFRDLCIGLSRVRGSALKHLGLPNGAPVDLYLLSEAKHWHVLLVDVADTVENLREFQQRAQDAELARYQKSKEVRLHSAAKLQDAAQLALAAAEIARLEAERALLLRHIQACRHAPALVRQLALVVDMMLAPADAAISGAQWLAWLQAAFADELNQGRLQCQAFAPELLWSGDQLAAMLWSLLAALARADKAPVRVECKSDASANYWLVHDDGPDYPPALSEALWDAQAPDWQSIAVERYLASWLFACGAALARQHGRATRHWSPALRMRLTLSWPPQLPQADSPAQISLPRRLPSRVAIIDAQEGRSVLLAVALRRMGCTVTVHAEIPNAPEACRDSECLILDPELGNGQGGRYAFQLRGLGWTGRLLALGALPKAPILKQLFNGVMPAYADQDALFESVALPE